MRPRAAWQGLAIGRGLAACVACAAGCGAREIIDVVVVAEVGVTDAELSDTPVVDVADAADVQRGA